MKERERVKRARKIVGYLKKKYPQPKSELHYKKSHEFLFAVMLSAQCTDKRVNKVTKTLYKKYPTLESFAHVSQDDLRGAISSISFPNNKARHIRETAQKLITLYKGRVPRKIEELLTLKGVARKTANVVRGELFDEWDGIAIDTHVKRFARKFDLSDAKSADALERDLCVLVPRKDWKYVNNGLILYGRYVCSAHVHECKDHALTKLWSSASTRWPRTVEK